MDRLLAVPFAVAWAVQLWRRRRAEQHAHSHAVGEVPEGANDGCVGPAAPEAGKAAGCAGCPNQGACASGEAAKPDPGLSEVAKRLKNVRRKILVLSGKGGVGKSTVSAQLAFALADSLEVGLLDVDICGPSAPKMLGVKGQEVHQSAVGWDPVYVDKLAVMSIGFMLPKEDDAIIWRGPKKHGLIRQFLSDVNWGELDALIIDTPPGTSDEHLSVVGQLKEAGVDGAIIVTTPQEVALQDVRKEVNFCKKVGVPIIGVVENMAGLKCPHCSGHVDVFQPTTGGAKALCQQYGLTLLGSLPLDPRVVQAGDAGKRLAVQNAGASPEMQSVVRNVRAALKI